MLNLQIASLYADLKIDTAIFDAQLARVRAQLAAVKVPTITPMVDNTQALMGLDKILARLQRVQRQALINARVSGGVGGLGGGRGGAFGGNQLVAGLGQGLGMPYASSPQMMAGQAIGMALKGSVGTAIDLEAKMAEVRRVAGLSADEAARLKREMLAISTVQPGATVDDLVKMAEVGGRMGIAGNALGDFASALAMVKNSVDGLDTEDLANNVARTLNVFKLGPEYIKGFGSALTALDNASTASAADILKVTQGLSGTAASIGVTLPQVMALSATLRDVGLPLGVSASAMSQVFRKMATNMDDFAAAAGVDAKEFADAYRKGPMEALAMLMRALNETADTVETQQLLKSLGLEGVRTGGALLQLAQAFDKVAPLAKKANDEFSSLGSLMAADGLKGETTAAAIGKMTNAFVGLADALGRYALPQINKTAEALTGLANDLRAGPGGWGHGNAQLGFFRGILGFDPFGSPPVAGGAAFFNKPKPAGAPALPAPAAVAGNGGNGGNGRPDAKGMRDAAEAGFKGLVAGIRNSPAAGLFRINGSALGQLGRQFSDALKANREDRPAASVGLSGADFARQQQQQILDGSAKDTAANTRQTADILRDMYQLMQRAKGQAINALLGPS